MVRMSKCPPVCLVLLLALLSPTGLALTLHIDDASFESFPNLNNSHSSGGTTFKASWSSSLVTSHARSSPPRDFHLRPPHAKETSGMCAAIAFGSSGIPRGLDKGNRATTNPRRRVDFRVFTDSIFDIKKSFITSCKVRLGDSNRAAQQSATAPLEEAPRRKAPLAFAVWDAPIHHHLLQLLLFTLLLLHHRRRHQRRLRNPYSLRRCLQCARIASRQHVPLAKNRLRRPRLLGEYPLA